MSTFHGEWPVVEGRYLCVTGRPMPADPPKDAHWIHPEAKHVDSTSDYFESFECPACGHRWSVELPE